MSRSKMSNIKGRKSARTDSRQKQLVVKEVREPQASIDGAPALAGGKKMGKTPAPLRGMKDRLPKEEAIWQKMFVTALGLTKAYGFGEIETPHLEEASLFVRSIGRGTDVVDKEMYIFEDRDGSKVALRPEATAGMVRAYITHGLHSLPQPVKLWQYGPMFRHERPQAGRYRQFHQFDCESFGERNPIVDAELIVVAYNFFRDLGIETQVDINSMGTLPDRERYVVELLGYLRTKRSYLCDDCKKRMLKNPLRVLDCKSCSVLMEEAPQIIDWLSEASKKYFMEVLEYLDELEVPYILRSTLVRGLDYYTDTVFEIYPVVDSTVPAASASVVEADIPAQSALAGGGRYDLLVEQLGGRPTPACGFAVGLERVAVLLRREAENADAKAKKPAVFMAQLGEQARRRALRIIEDLRRAGILVHHHLGKPSLKVQLELANKYGATHTLIIGQKEVLDDTIIVRDMESGIQEIIDQRKVKNEVEKILKS